MECISRTLDTVQARGVSWLWKDRIPLGKVTMLAGDPGLGKSFLTTWLAARVTNADAFPDVGPSLRAPASVVFLSAEDDPHDTIVPRLKLAGADLSRVVFVEGVRDGDGRGECLSLDRHAAALDRLVRSIDRPRLIVVDPVSAYLGEADGNSNGQVRSLLRELAEIGMRHGCAVVCVTHLNKGGSANATSQKAIYRLMGSLAFTAAARAVYFVRALPGENERALALVKSNLQMNRGVMTYRVGERGIEWTSVNASLSIAQVEEEDDNTLSAVEEAANFLREALGDGPVSAAQLREDARAVGISEASIERARRMIGARAVRDAKAGSNPGAGRWLIALPPQGGAA
ncbi:MAG TPA: AAA family ATPase [Phycisphaerales bacterium]|nr:AAA family ATPase [Phycisphaerales bacterium]